MGVLVLWFALFFLRISADAIAQNATKKNNARVAMKSQQTQQQSQSAITTPARPIYSNNSTKHTHTRKNILLLRDARYARDTRDMIIVHFVLCCMYVCMYMLYVRICFSVTGSGNGGRFVQCIRRGGFFSLCGHAHFHGWQKHVAGILHRPAGAIISKHTHSHSESLMHYILCAFRSSYGTRLRQIDSIIGWGEGVWAAARQFSRLVCALESCALALAACRHERGGGEDLAEQQRNNAK